MRKLVPLAAAAAALCLLAYPAPACNYGVAGYAAVVPVAIPAQIVTAYTPTVSVSVVPQFVSCAPAVSIPQAAAIPQEQLAAPTPCVSSAMSYAPQATYAAPAIAAPVAVAAPVAFAYQQAVVAAVPFRAAAFYGAGVNVSVVRAANVHRNAGVRVKVVNRRQGLFSRIRANRAATVVRVRA
jgi:hypothetical protein